MAGRSSKLRPSHGLVQLLIFESSSLVLPLLQDCQAALPGWRHPITPSLGEPQITHQVQEVLPAHGVESLCNVQFKEQGRHLGSVITSGRIAHRHEVIVDATLLDDGRGDTVHKRC